MSLLNKASLVLTPNSVKESKLYSIIPSNGNGDMVVTRATTATRVNSEGFIEEVPYNLVKYSEMFTDTSWDKQNSTIVANVIIAPNGTLTGDRFTGSGVSSSHNINQSVNFTQNTSYTFTTYIKRDTNNFVQLVMPSPAFGNNSWANFDLLNGVLGTVASNSSASIFNVGNGWFRCTITATAIAQATTTFFICLIPSSTSTRLEVNTLNTSIYVWGTQLVQGSVQKDYFPTTDRLNVPRLNYDVAGGCPSILLEPQRTNLLTDSETYSVNWGSNFTSITKDLLSPTNSYNASTIVNNAGANVSIFKTISVVSGNTYQFSFYIKKLSGSWSNTQALRLTSWGAAVTSQTYTDLGTIITNNWVRYTHTFTASSTGTVVCQLVSNQINTFGLWGAQLEQGTYPTSYIPTVASTVTRNADDIYKTNISSLLNPSEGTFYVEAKGVANDSASRIITLSDNSDYNQISIQFSNTNQIRLDTYGKTGTTTTTNFRYASPIVNTASLHKVAIVWGSSGIFGFIDGVKYTLIYVAGTVGGNGIPTALTRLDFKQYWGGNPFFSKTQLVGIWKTALTDTEMIALTTL